MAAIGDVQHQLRGFLGEGRCFRHVVVAGDVLRRRGGRDALGSTLIESWRALTPVLALSLGRITIAGTPLSCAVITEEQLDLPFWATSH